MSTPIDYTVDGLLTAVRDYIGISPNSEDGTNARLLRLLNREQSLYLTKLLTKAMAKHRESPLDIPVGALLTYDIPTRAVAAGLVKVEGIDANGNTWMLFETNGSQVTNWWPRNGHFYVQGNQLIFYQQPPVGTLRLTYNRRLSFLVLTAAVATITSINTSNGAVGVSSTPAGFSSSTPFDLVRANPHFDILGMDLSATVVGTAFGFSASSLPPGLAVGDYVCLSSQANVCQAPYELHSVLAQRVAYIWLLAKGDERVQTAAGALKEMEALAAQLIEPRIEREAPMTNPNSPGWQSVWRGFRG